MTNDILLTLILDGSGSMGHLRDATIEGVNSILEQQANEEGTAYVSMVVFSTTFDVRCVAREISEVAPLSHANYQCNGGTALYDAVVIGVKGTEEWLKAHPEFDGSKLVVIFTDGEENSSTQWRDIDAVNKTIDAKQKQGWIFNFVGSGGSAWTEAKKFAAIPQQNFTRVYATNTSTSGTYAAMNVSTSNLRSTGLYNAPQGDVSGDDLIT